MKKKTLTAVLLSMILVIGLAASGFAGHVPAAAVTDQEDKAAVKGIDVSEHNGSVDFAKVSSQGYTYVMLRVGAGKNTTDSTFEDNYTAAGRESLKRGAYYYSYAVTVDEAKAEADRCLDMLAGRKLELPVAFDIEEPSAFETGVDNCTAMAKTFCDEIKNAGYDPMIYSSQNKILENLNHDQLSGYKFWVASYDVDYPNYPYPYYMWQYKLGSVDGANTLDGKCDVNYIYENFVEADDVQIEPQSMDLKLGEGQVSTGSVKATVGPAESSNKHVNYSSSDESVAIVDSMGNVTALANGNTDITASSVNDVEAVCSVTVTTPATGITIGNDDLDIGKKEELTIEPVLEPVTSTDKTHYKSLDEDKAEVTEEGKIRGLQRGKARIQCTTDSGVSTTVTVNIKKAPGYLRGLKLIKNMKVGESYQSKLRISKGSASNKIKYYSRNKYKVSFSDTGEVKALKTGWCLLRAETYNGKKEYELVHVTE